MQAVQHGSQPSCCKALRSRAALDALTKAEGVEKVQTEVSRWWSVRSGGGLVRFLPEIGAMMACAEAEKAQATRQAYASDWRDFAA
jgi:hypothetical protein